MKRTNKLWKKITTNWTGTKPRPITLSNRNVRQNQAKEVSRLQDKLISMGIEPKYSVNQILTSRGVSTSRGTFRQLIIYLRAQIARAEMRSPPKIKAGSNFPTKKRITFPAKKRIK